jgi:hypothetical protein
MSAELERRLDRNPVNQLPSKARRFLLQRYTDFRIKLMIIPRYLSASVQCVLLDQDRLRLFKSLDANENK